MRLLAQTLRQEQSHMRIDVNKLPCPVNKIIRSPKIHHYRSQDEFSTGIGHDDKKTVGYFAFTATYDNQICVEPDDLEVLKECHVKTANLLNEYIRDVTPLGLSIAVGTDGGWRRFGVRSNRANEIMAIGFLNPRTLTVKQVKDEKARFADFMSTKMPAESGAILKSLYIQQCPHSRCSHSSVPYELIFGQPHIEEEYNSMKIQLLPECFVPSNFEAAEKFCLLVKDQINELFPIKLARKEGKQRIIIDLNSGPGLLSLHLNEIADSVIGIDGSSQSTEIAQKNAQLNSIRNVQFINSAPENVLDKLLQKYTESDIVIVCHLGRGGLHRSVISAIRRCRHITKIIYITGNPEGKALENFRVLCHRHMELPSIPFYPIMATPIDMLPHTNHVELLVAFERDL